MATDPKAKNKIVVMNRITDKYLLIINPASLFSFVSLLIVIFPGIKYVFYYD